ncbi:unnamed protein product [Clavelina lepadiformis]|uniref:Uncharacterized protein n=1 Tax=Clavelina lepadiformis TaxID=159417 RepID=A0ABP0FPL2_CLALP
MSGGRYMTVLLSLLALSSNAFGSFLVCERIGDDGQVLDSSASFVKDFLSIDHFLRAWLVGLNIKPQQKLELRLKGADRSVVESQDILGNLIYDLRDVYLSLKSKESQNKTNNVAGQIDEALREESIPPAIDTAGDIGSKGDNFIATDKNEMLYVDWLIDFLEEVKRSNFSGNPNDKEQNRTVSNTVERKEFIINLVNKHSLNSLRTGRLMIFLHEYHLTLYSKEESRQEIVQPPSHGHVLNRLIFLLRAWLHGLNTQNQKSVSVNFLPKGSKELNPSEDRIGKVISEILNVLNIIETKEGNANDSNESNGVEESNIPTQNTKGDPGIDMEDLSGFKEKESLFVEWLAEFLKEIKEHVLSCHFKTTANKTKGMGKTEGFEHCKPSAPPKESNQTKGDGLSRPLGPPSRDEGYGDVILNLALSHQFKAAKMKRILEFLIKLRQLDAIGLKPNSKSTASDEFKLFCRHNEKRDLNSEENVKDEDSTSAKQDDMLKTMRAMIEKLVWKKFEEITAILNNTEHDEVASALQFALDKITADKSDLTQRIAVEEWSSCSASCGRGIQTRQSSCSDEEVALCINGFVEETRPCQHGVCPEDPCKEGRHNCHDDAECESSSDGTFTCSCKKNYHGDGFNCKLECLPSDFDPLKTSSHICYSLHAKVMKPFEKFIEYCDSQGGKVATIYDLKTWIQIVWWLREISAANFTNAAMEKPYIGMYRNEVDEWKYFGTTNGTSTFVLWGQGEPNHDDFDHNCLVLDPMTGQTESVSCDTKAFAICSVERQEAP